MGKNTPLARGVRTVVLALAGSAGSWALIDWVTDFRAGAALVTLHVIAAGVAGLSAYLLALAGLTATTAWGKALVTFGQLAAPGVGAVVITDLSASSLVNGGRAIVTTLIAAGIAAAAALMQNAAEDKPA
jgi:hypothetical protein